MNLPVRTTPESDIQIREIDDWWRNNRSAAPDLFLQELITSFDVIAHAPLIADFIDGRLSQALAGSCSRYLAITSHVGLEGDSRIVANTVRSDAPAARCRQQALIRATEEARRPAWPARSGAQLPKTI